ncbi:hypothetical protein FB45DRAFT_375787 [Roridomyces roridus]|uniref:Uncharacterized protein n=1 Tax=Roridomyces roridus TaxID=1738132 RepID=A0AAD7F8R0_9AGAR|nr:hypothetical protein FB45DRAFT_375787 [Roridomyces roridus]
MGVESIDCFEIAPSLLEMGVYTESRYIPFVFPVNNLTTHRVQGPWDMHHLILKTAPNIVEARIVIHADQLWPERSDDFIDMLHLRRLYVSDLEVFDYIRAPALAELAMYVEPEPGSQLEHFDSFLARSLCALRWLCLRGSPNPSITATILNKHLSITSFVLDDASSDSDPDLVSTAMDGHCRLLTVGNSCRTAVAPHLSEISFGSRRPSTSIDYPLFLKMLESRHRAADCALSTAAFLTEFGPLPDPATFDCMDALRKDGFRLHVESGWGAAYIIDCWTYAASWAR